MSIAIFSDKGGSHFGGDHKDAYIASNSGSTSTASTVFVVVDDLAGASAWPGLLRFSLVGHIPENAIISSAIITLVVSHRAGAFAIQAHKLLTPWGVTPINEGGDEDPATGGQVTWDNAFDYASGADVGWAAGVGAGFGAGDYRAAFQISEVAAAVGSVLTIAVTDDVQEMVQDDDANCGWLMQGTVHATGNRFHSRNAVALANRPFLTVVYTVPPINAPRRSKVRIGIANRIGT